MSLEVNSDAIIFGGLPYSQRGRVLGPFRIRTVLENMGLTTSLIDYFWDQPFDKIVKHINYCIGSNTLIFGISYTWVIDIMLENMQYKMNTSEEYRQKNGYATTDELLILIITWLRINYPKIVIVLGSASAVNINRQLLKHIDWVIDGFAELSLPALVNHIQTAKELTYSIKEGIKYIDSNKDYKVTDMHILTVQYKYSDQFAPHQPLALETCRGCLWNCAYCRYAFRGKKNYEYIRNEDNIAYELQNNYEMFGTTNYMIVDDTFNDSEEKIVRVLRAVKKSKIPNFQYVCYLRPEMLINRPNMISLLLELGLSGAHIGLESVNDHSRRLMGRSNSYEKIKEQICSLKQRSSRYIGIMGTYIIGLPYDSIDDIRLWNDTLCNEQGVFLDQWWWYPLQMNARSIGQRINFGMDVINSDTSQSLIEKTPNKFGYNIHYEKSNDRFAWWSNKFMDYDKSNDLAIELFKKNKLYNGLGGWSVGIGWHFGLSEQELANKKLWECNFQNLGVKECSSRFQYWDGIVENHYNDDKIIYK